MILTFIVGIILNFVDLKMRIFVKEIPEFDKKIEEINNRIDKVYNNDCKEVLYSLSERIEYTYYETDIRIKDYVDRYYNNEEFSYNDFYNLYLNAKDVCGIDNSEIDVDALASKSYPETVKTRINTNHIIDFKDYFNYKNAYELSDNIGTYTNKTLELKTVKELVDEVYKKENNNK